MQPKHLFRHGADAPVACSKLQPEQGLRAIARTSRALPSSVWRCCVMRLHQQHIPMQRPTAADSLQASPTLASQSSHETLHPVSPLRPPPADQSKVVWWQHSEGVREAQVTDAGQCSGKQHFHR